MMCVGVHIVGGGMEVHSVGIVICTCRGVLLGCVGCMGAYVRRMYVLEVKLVTNE